MKRNLIVLFVFLEFMSLRSSAANFDCIGPGSHSDYSLVNKKNSIHFNEEIFSFQYDINETRVFFNLVNNNWTIKKLTDKELILETINFNNQKVRLKLNKM
jgi:hypothetical protein